MTVRKVVIEPQDYGKIMDFMNSLPIPFAQVEKAAEIKTIMQKVQVMDIDIKETGSNNS